MNRRTLLRTAGLGVTSLVGCTSRGGAPSSPNGSPGDDPTDTPSETPTSDPARPSIANPSFEEGLVGWTVGRDLPHDPNNPGHEVAAEAGVSTAYAATGRRSLELSIDGRQDDGTLWVQQPVDLADAETLAVDAYSQQKSFNIITKVAAYAGPDPGRPLEEADFDTERPVEDHEGWKTYEYRVDHDGPGLVAVGVSVVWETELTRYVDDVQLG